MKRIAISFPLALTAALTCGILLALTVTLAQSVFMQRQWNLEAQQNQQRIEARRLEEQQQRTAWAADAMAQAPKQNAYVIQVGSKQNQTEAFATFADMQQKYPTLLASYRPMLQRVDLG